MNINKLFFTASIILALAFQSVFVLAQPPQKVSYQMVVRDATGVLVKESTVGVQVSILQGSADGSAVYVETHSPQSNVNGLVSIEVGNGTPVQNTFAGIDWANGPYFLKAETDPAGGSTYTISGISEILSVPYALHAKTAESITGDGSSSRYVGELYGGGVVFWVDQTGQHGLIVSMIDLSTDQAWSNIDGTEIGTTNDWDGASNTTAIIGQSGHTSSAAQLCTDYTNDDYGTGVYSDWYLPSIAELNHVWNNFYEVQKALTNDGNASTTPLARTIYWSSSEYGSYSPWCFFFDEGTAFDHEGKFYGEYVRAVRAF